MRVISQNGVDFPYESIAISYGDGTIYARPVSNMDKTYVLARYSSDEKMEKAMRMLHKLYAKLPDAISEVEKKIYITGCFNGVGDEYVEPERSDYFVFRFPQEDEI